MVPDLFFAPLVLNALVWLCESIKILGHQSVF